MARTALPITSLPANYAASPQALAWTAADNVNGNSIVLTGREILLVQNTDAASQTVTINSAADAYGRTGDITAFAMAAGSFYAFQKFPTSGWEQTDGTLHLTASAATVKFVVLREPS